MKLTDKEVKEVGYRRLFNSEVGYKTLIPLGIGAGVAFFIAFIAAAAQTSNGYAVVDALAGSAFAIGAGWTFCSLWHMHKRSNRAGEDFVKKYHEEEHHSGR